jgi:3-oxoadipate enol-lactonase
METPSSQEDVARLTRAVDSVRPLIEGFGEPLRVAVDGELRPLQERLDFVTARSGAPRLTLCPAELLPQPDFVERIVTERVAPACRVAPFEPHSAGRVIDSVLATTFERMFPRTTIRSFDGAALPTYAGGQGEEAVVIASVCGMPAKLYEGWMTLLARDFFVVTWESRGLFAELDDFEGLACSVDAQAADLFAVMDFHGIERAHVLGLCGGAVLTLAAAAARPERVMSIGLWHGDYYLGADGPQTKHQRDLRALITMAGEDRRSAAALRAVLAQTMMLPALPADIVPMVVYPYATAELLHRYGKLNGAIMTTDITPLLRHVSQRALVVTSEDDHTAHPAGSHRVAAALPNAMLHLESHGDHISLFGVPAGVSEPALQFLSAERSRPAQVESSQRRAT